MVTILDTIENEPVSWNGQIISFTSLARIDDDGGGDSHGDPDFQNNTTYQPRLNADVDRYIVLPPQIIGDVGPMVLGSKVVVFNKKTGMTTDAVVGDVGPHRKLGEMSMACARALGIPDSPTRGGDDVHEIFYQVWPGIPAQVGDTAYVLQPHRAA